MEFTHLDEKGKAKMVEITDKPDTKRVAVASGKVLMKSDTVSKIKDSKIKKGDVLTVAKIAGIIGAKRTSDIVPMCHPLMLTGIDVKFTIEDYGIYIESEVKNFGKTGVEMEALTAVSISALTIYDMCKSVDKSMKITDTYLKYKSGGKSGEYKIGEVLSINISEKKGVVKKPVLKGEFIENFGLKDDAHAGKWHRQVSILAQESIDKMKKIGIEGLCSGKFAENITTKGIILHKLPIGTKLKIGETVQEISQIGKECHDGCDIKKTVGQCIMPKEGIFTKVLKSGIISTGDSIIIVE